MSALREHVAKWSKGQGDDMKSMALRQCDEWDATIGQLQMLQADDPEAEHTLRAAGELLASITVNYGPVHSWTLGQHHIIFRTACRVFGSEQLLFGKPNWTEQF